MPADPVAPSARRERVSQARIARRAAAFVALVALAAMAAVLYRLGTPHRFFDLKIYMKAMRWWADGHPLYDYVQPDRVQGELYFTYPPFAGLLLRPFAGLPLGATVAIFTSLTIVAVAVTSWWLVAPVAGRRGRSRWFAAAVATLLVLGFESTRETITFGQINMLLVVLILADLLFAVPGNSRWSGVGVGLATALKLFPGIFIIYLLVSRRWRAAAVASATAAAATLLAAAVAPGDSWRFWTHELWLTNRVGRTDYTGNQSLFGLLSRFTVPDKPSQLLWLAVVVVVAGYGLWRAGRAGRAGDHLVGLTLTGLVGALISPITWTHHVYWFVPALVVLVDAGLGEPDKARGGEPGRGPAVAARRPRVTLLALALAAVVLVDASLGRRDKARGGKPGRTPGAEPGREPAEVGRGRRPALLALAATVYACATYGVVSYYDWGVAPERTNSPVEFVLRNLYVLLALVLLVALPTRRPRPQRAIRD